MDYESNPVLLAIIGVPNNPSKMRRNPESPHHLTRKNIEASIAGEPTNNSKWRREQSERTLPIEQVYELINGGHYSG